MVRLLHGGRAVRVSLRREMVSGRTVVRRTAVPGFVNVETVHTGFQPFGLHKYNDAVAIRIEADSPADLAARGRCQPGNRSFVSRWQFGGCGYVAVLAAKQQ